MPDDSKTIDKLNINRINGNEGQKSISLWERMINGIVRPPRSKYKKQQIGRQQFYLNNNLYYRRDEIVIHEQKNIELTYFQAVNCRKWIILYLHGNSSSRLQAVNLLKYIPDRFSLACFDFMGCGHNEQTNVVTLGYSESKQVQTIVKVLRNKNYEIILWGRSMGAATALKYGKAKIIVADSSFKSLQSLCKQVAKIHSPIIIPNCLISCLFPCVFCKMRKDIEEKGKYDVNELDIKSAIKEIDPNTLLILMTALEDEIIHPRNSKKLYDLFEGKQKQLISFPGKHNSKRPQIIIKDVMNIIQKQVMKLEKISLHLN